MAYRIGKGTALFSFAGLILPVTSVSEPVALPLVDENGKSRILTFGAVWKDQPSHCKQILRTVLRIRATPPENWKNPVFLFSPDFSFFALTRSFPNERIGQEKNRIISGTRFAFSLYWTSCRKHPSCFSETEPLFKEAKENVLCAHSICPAGLPPFWEEYSS